MLNVPKRGEIWLVRLDPTVGREIKKTRPAFIISNDINNQYAPLVTVLPISDRGAKVYPFEIAVCDENTGISKPSKVKCQQIRTIDKARLVKRLGAVGKECLPDIEDALKLHLGID